MRRVGAIGVESGGWESSIASSGRRGAEPRIASVDFRGV